MIFFQTRRDDFNMKSGEVRVSGRADEYSLFDLTFCREGKSH